MLLSSSVLLETVQFYQCLLLGLFLCAHCTESLEYVPLAAAFLGSGVAESLFQTEPGCWMVLRLPVALPNVFR